MRNKIFVAVFAAFIVAIMICAPTKMFLTKAGVIQTENVGNEIEVEKLYTAGTFGASFFNSVEQTKRDINDTYINYLPFYVPVTSAAEEFTQNLNRPVSKYLLDWGNRITLARRENAPERWPNVLTGTNKPDTNKPGTSTQTPELEPVSYEYETFFLKDKNRHRYYRIMANTPEGDFAADFYIRVPSQDAEKLRPTMEKQAAAVNDLAARRPDVNWYVFPVTCFEDTAICDQLLPAESKYGLFTEFFARLSNDVQYDYIKINDITVKEKLYFKTDHHWNAYGYAEGYRLITEMFKENYPDIVARTPTFYTFDNQVTVYGSNARAVANYRMSDVFHVADFSLPEHTYELETGVSYGRTDSFQTNLEKYKNKEHNTARGYDHYVNFSPIVKEVTYPQNSTGRNLLIIGDSYALPLLEVVASHFDKTYIRYVDANKSLTDVKYEDLIDEYGITDVLYLEMSDRIIYDYYSDSLKGLK